MAKVLPDREIKRFLGRAIIDGAPECIGVNSYEVRLGGKALFYATGEEVGIPPGSYLEIDPGDLVAVESLEKVDFSQNIAKALDKPYGIFAWITPTTTMMREGFGFASTKVDAGYRGNLNWSIRNNSIKPIRLQQGERIFKLTIMELEAGEEPEKFYGEREQDHYQDTSGIKESARMIQANIPEKLLIKRAKSKVEPITQRKYVPNARPFSPSFYHCVLHSSAVISRIGRAQCFRHRTRPNQKSPSIERRQMAAKQVTRSKKRRKPDPFAIVRGKVVERIEVSTMDDDCAIGILFKDRTYLGFDIEPFLRITPDFSDWKTHNYKRIKRWPPLRTE